MLTTCWVLFFDIFWKMFEIISFLFIHSFHLLDLHKLLFCSRFQWSAHLDMEKLTLQSVEERHKNPTRILSGCPLGHDLCRFPFAQLPRSRSPKFTDEDKLQFREYLCNLCFAGNAEYLSVWSFSSTAHFHDIKCIFCFIFIFFNAPNFSYF